MNKVILMGRLTRDAESRMTSGSLEISRFSLAVSNDFVNRNGERDTEFVNCVAFGNTAGAINKFCKKGTAISVIGRLRTSSYDAQDGSKRYSTEVIVESFEFAGSRGSNTAGSSNNNYDMPSFEQPKASMPTADVSNDPYKDFGDEITLSSDDLPF